MPINRRLLISAALGMTIAPGAAAQQWGNPTPARDAPDRPVWPPQEFFRLWPGKAPGAPKALPVPHDTMNGPTGDRQLWLYGVPEPILAVYRPAKPDGRALLSIPGGGYGFLSVQNEGIDVANRYTPEGITVFVLAYRLPGEGWANRADVPLQDAQRAMRLIRERATMWKVDPERLGVIGFSAGGHLAAALTVGHDDRVYAPVDAADRQSARPRFSALIYPLIDLSLAPKSGSAVNLLGPAPTAETVARYDTSHRVTKQTPPLFLVQAMDDGLVNPDNTLAMVGAARSAEVPVEAHLFQEGGHGFGPNHLPKNLPASRWTETFGLWVARHTK